MWYVVINFLTIELGGFISAYSKKYLSDEIITAVLIIANVAVAIIGIQGAIETQNSILMLISLIVGAVIGTALNINGLFHKLGGFLKKSMNSKDENFSKGFITAVMIQGVGALAILAPLDMALRGDPSLLLFKSVLDFFSSLIYGSLYGRSVMLSGPLILIYQLAIFLLADFISPFLGPDVVVEISAVGSTIIFALSLSLLELIDLKTANYLPALLVPIIYFWVLGLF